MGYMKTQLCPFWMSGQCINGKSCYFAHSQDEIRPLPPMMMNHMMGMPGPPMGPPMMMNPMALMGQHMMRPPMQMLPNMLANLSAEGNGSDKKYRRKDEKDGKEKSKKRKD